MHQGHQTFLNNHPQYRSAGLGVFPSSSAISDPCCSGLEKRAGYQGKCSPNAESESVERSFIMQHRVPKREAKRKGSRLRREGDTEGSFKNASIIFPRETNIVVPNWNSMETRQSVKSLLDKHEDWGHNASTHVKAGCGALHLYP